ncbi:MAG: hypothetical protein K0S06_3278 [Microvirga sp.]|nr:hypothetical protein [Microvirga sp.]
MAAEAFVIGGLEEERRAAAEEREADGDRPAVEREHVGAARHRRFGAAEQGPRERGGGFAGAKRGAAPTFPAGGLERKEALDSPSQPLPRREARELHAPPGLEAATASLQTLAAIGAEPAARIAVVGLAPVQHRAVERGEDLDREPPSSARRDQLPADDAIEAEKRQPPQRPGVRHRLDQAMHGFGRSAPRDEGGAVHHEMPREPGRVASPQSDPAAHLHEGEKSLEGLALRHRDEAEPPVEKAAGGMRLDHWPAVERVRVCRLSAKVVPGGAPLPKRGEVQDPGLEPRRGRARQLVRTQQKVHRITRRDAWRARGAPSLQGPAPSRAPPSRSPWRPRRRRSRTAGSARG